MLVYEVTLSVEPDIAAPYSLWLDEHVQQMLALPGFVDARRYDVIEPVDGRVAYCVHYRLRDAEALQQYLAEHAEAMREAGRKRFGERFSASRRVLQLHEAQKAE